MTTGIQGHPQAGQGPELITIGFMLHLSYMVSQHCPPPPCLGRPGRTSCHAPTKAAMHSLT